MEREGRAKGGKGEEGDKGRCDKEKKIEGRVKGEREFRIRGDGKRELRRR